MTAQIGHNNPPFDFFSFFDVVVESSASSYEKLLAIILARHASKRTGVAFPSRERLMRQASCSEKTFKRSRAALEAFFDANSRLGKTTEYRPKQSITVDQIEAALCGIKKTQGGLTDPGSHRPGVSQTPGGGLTDPTGGVSQTPHKDLVKDLVRKDPPKAPQGGVEEKGIWIDHDGIVRVVNGNRVALEKILSPKQDLNVELAKIAPKLSPQASSVELLTQVSALLAASAQKAKARKKQPSDTYSADFQSFWVLYPRRDGKGKAADVWERLAIDQKRRAYLGLKKQLPVLQAKMKEDGGKYCPMPATWLNQSRWDDEPVASIPDGKASKFTTFEEQRAERERAVNSAYLKTIDVPTSKPRPRDEVL
jgi:hypothetical protein